MSGTLKKFEEMGRDIIMQEVRENSTDMNTVSFRLTDSDLARLDVLASMLDQTRQGVFLSILDAGLHDAVFGCLSGLQLEIDDYGTNPQFEKAVQDRAIEIMEKKTKKRSEK